MSKIFVYFSLLALMGFVFAGTIVKVGETVEVGGLSQLPPNQKSPQSLQKQRKPKTLEASSLPMKKEIQLI